MVLQAKISASTVVLREVLIEQQQGQQAAIASLVVLPGCNRTVDMQYVFVVGLHKSPVFRTSSNFATFFLQHCALSSQILWQSVPPATSHMHRHMTVLD